MENRGYNFTFQFLPGKNILNSEKLHKYFESSIIVVNNFYYTSMPVSFNQQTKRNEYRFNKEYYGGSIFGESQISLPNIQYSTPDKDYIYNYTFIKSDDMDKIKTKFVSKPYEFKFCPENEYDNILEIVGMQLTYSGGLWNQQKIDHLNIIIDIKDEFINKVNTGISKLYNIKKTTNYIINLNAADSLKSNPYTYDKLINQKNNINVLSFMLSNNQIVGGEDYVYKMRLQDALNEDDGEKYYIGENIKTETPLFKILTVDNKITDKDKLEEIEDFLVKQWHLYFAHENIWQSYLKIESLNLTKIEDGNNKYWKADGGWYCLDIEIGYEEIPSDKCVEISFVKFGKWDDTDQTKRLVKMNRLFYDDSSDITNDSSDFDTHDEWVITSEKYLEYSVNDDNNKKYHKCVISTQSVFKNLTPESLLFDFECYRNICLAGNEEHSGPEEPSDPNEEKETYYIIDIVEVSNKKYDILIAKQSNQKELTLECTPSNDLLNNLPLSEILNQCHDNSTIFNFSYPKDKFTIYSTNYLNNIMKYKDIEYAYINEIINNIVDIYASLKNSITDYDETILNKKHLGFLYDNKDTKCWFPKSGKTVLYCDEEIIQQLKNISNNESWNDNKKSIETYKICKRWFDIELFVYSDDNNTNYTEFFDLEQTRLTNNNNIEFIIHPGYNCSKIRDINDENHKILEAYDIQQFCVICTHDDSINLSDSYFKNLFKINNNIYFNSLYEDKIIQKTIYNSRYSENNNPSFNFYLPKENYKDIVTEFELTYYDYDAFVNQLKKYFGFELRWIDGDADIHIYDVEYEIINNIPTFNIKVKGEPRTSKIILNFDYQEENPDVKGKYIHLAHTTYYRRCDGVYRAGGSSIYNKESITCSLGASDITHLNELIDASHNINISNESTDDWEIKYAPIKFLNYLYDIYFSGENITDESLHIDDIQKKGTNTYEVIIKDGKDNIKYGQYTCKIKLIADENFENLHSDDSLTDIKKLIGSDSMIITSGIYDPLKLLSNDNDNPNDWVNVVDISEENINKLLQGFTETNNDGDTPVYKAKDTNVFENVIKEIFGYQFRDPLLYDINNVFKYRQKICQLYITEIFLQKATTKYNTNDSKYVLNTYEIKIKVDYYIKQLLNLRVRIKKDSSIDTAEIPLRNAFNSNVLMKTEHIGGLQYINLPKRIININNYIDYDVSINRVNEWANRLTNLCLIITESIEEVNKDIIYSRNKQLINELNIDSEQFDIIWKSILSKHKTEPISDLIYRQELTSYKVINLYCDEIMFNNLSSFISNNDQKAVLNTFTDYFGFGFIESGETGYNFLKYLELKSSTVYDEEGLPLVKNIDLNVGTTNEYDAKIHQVIPDPTLQEIYGDRPDKLNITLVENNKYGDANFIKKIKNNNNRIVQVKGKYLNYADVFSRNELNEDVSIFKGKYNGYDIILPSLEDKSLWNTLTSLNDYLDKYNFSLYPIQYKYNYITGCIFEKSSESTDILMKLEYDTSTEAFNKNGLISYKDNNVEISNKNDDNKTNTGDTTSEEEINPLDKIVKENPITLYFTNTNNTCDKNVYSDFLNCKRDIFTVVGKQSGDSWRYNEKDNISICKFSSQIKISIDDYEDLWFNSSLNPKDFLKDYFEFKIVLSSSTKHIQGYNIFLSDDKDDDKIYIEIIYDRNFTRTEDTNDDIAEVKKIELENEKSKSSTGNNIEKLEKVQENIISESNIQNNSLVYVVSLAKDIFVEQFSSYAFSTNKGIIITPDDALLYATQFYNMLQSTKIKEKEISYLYTTMVFDENNYEDIPVSKKAKKQTRLLELDKTEKNNGVYSYMFITL